MTIRKICSMKDIFFPIEKNVNSVFQILSKCTTLNWLNYRISKESFHSTHTLLTIKIDKTSWTYSTFRIVVAGQYGRQYSLLDGSRLSQLSLSNSKQWLIYLVWVCNVYVTRLERGKKSREGENLKRRQLVGQGDAWHMRYMMPGDYII